MTGRGGGKPARGAAHARDGTWQPVLRRWGVDVRLSELGELSPGLFHQDGTKQLRLCILNVTSKPSFGAWGRGRDDSPASGLLVLCPRNPYHL